jgi:hypothetical protein
MPSKRASVKRLSTPPDTRDAVDQHLRELDHPLKPAIELLRSTVLDASPEIAEGVKWNAPSFFLKTTGAYFATINVHRRSKAEGHLLEWLAKDRCAATFHDLNEVEAKRAALQDIVRQWIAHA